jgi:hypothetical protein
MLLGYLKQAPEISKWGPERALYRQKHSLTEDTYMPPILRLSDRATQKWIRRTCHPFSAPSLPTPSFAFARERRRRRHDKLPHAWPPPSPSFVPVGRGPFVLGGKAARPRPPHREEAQGQKRWLSPPSTAATALVALRHCSVCVLGDGGKVDGSGAGELQLDGGGVLIQHVDLIDAVIVGVGNGASALRTRPGWRPGGGRDGGESNT